MRGHGFAFSKIRDQVYSQLAASIANEIDRLWADDWDIDTIILSGGGCRELAPFLEPLITGNVIPVDLSRDPRLNNVLGYMKYGRFVWGEGGNGSAPERVTPETQPQADPAEDIESVSEAELSEV
jgi:plasmid segregation protein ParM